jgi:hypothetical protein
LGAGVERFTARAKIVQREIPRLFAFGDHLDRAAVVIACILADSVVIKR